jgi:hypothetical protein
MTSPLVTDESTPVCPRRATAGARYSITSADGTVRGSATFTLSRRDDDSIKISRLEVVPD